MHVHDVFCVFHEHGILWLGNRTYGLSLSPSFSFSPSSYVRIYTRGLKPSQGAFSNPRPTESVRPSVRPSVSQSAVDIDKWRENNMLFEHHFLSFFLSFFAGCCLVGFLKFFIRQTVDVTYVRTYVRVAMC